jgi:hypothetical protein
MVVSYAKVILIKLLLLYISTCNTDVSWTGRPRTWLDTTSDCSIGLALLNGRGMRGLSKAAVSLRRTSLPS